jgi:hypothetical protein
MFYKATQLATIITIVNPPAAQDRGGRAEEGCGGLKSVDDGRRIPAFARLLALWYIS